MRLTLIVESGDAAGKKFDVRAGQEFRVGRDAPCEARISTDSMLSNPHFVLVIDGEIARLRDCGSKFGTLRNAEKITECELNSGDRIRAGKTEFSVKIVSDQPAVAPPEPPPSAVPAAPKPAADPVPAGRTYDVLSFLRGMKHLYAVLDAARELTIPQRLMESKVECESLYETPQALDVQWAGPWLVRLPSDSPFLPKLIHDGWGKSWGVYLNCDKTFAEVRHHLRRFVKAMLPGNKPVFFRFYDPRVLRIYLPTCTTDEWKNFAGPITDYFMEGNKPNVLLHFASVWPPQPKLVSVTN